MGAAISSEADIVDELHQVPEAAPCHPSSSPLSPQLSLTRGASYLGPLIRVSDPYNILSPSSSSPRVHSSSRLNNTASSSHRSTAQSGFPVEDFCTEIYFIRHAESTMNVKPELIGGRTPAATLTGLGKRQARALGVHFRSLGVEFDAVYCSSLERAKQTAFAVCQELDIPRDAVELTEAVAEASQGQWEGKARSEIYTPARILLMNSIQPDFRAPGGESQREVEYRMMEFLNNVVLSRASSTTGLQKARRQRGSREHLHKIQVHPLDVDAESDLTSEYQLPKAQIPDSMSSTNLAASEDLTSHHETSAATPFTVAVISHGLAIKCMLGGLTGSNPHFTRRWCIDNTSVTVVRHSIRKGWEIQRINDTSHLRLL